MITPVVEKPTRRPIGLTIGDEPVETFVKEPSVDHMPGPFRNRAGRLLLLGAAAAAAGLFAYYLFSAPRDSRPNR